MRRILFACLLLVVAVLVSGCSQQPAPVVTPVPTTLPPIATPVPVSTITTTYQKHIDIAASQDGSDIIVRYDGGADASRLTALEIAVVSYNMQTRNEVEQNPVVGQKYVFPQMGSADPDLVTVTGVFSDGSRQKLVETKV